MATGARALRLPLGDTLPLLPHRLAGAPLATQLPHYPPISNRSGEVCKSLSYSDLRRRLTPLPPPLPRLGL